MPKVKITPIPSLDTPWDGYTAERVEEFIKKQLREASSGTSSPLAISDEEIASLLQ